MNDESPSDTITARRLRARGGVLSRGRQRMITKALIIVFVPVPVHRLHLVWICRHAPYRSTTMELDVPAVVAAVSSQIVDGGPFDEITQRHARTVLQYEGLRFTTDGKILLMFENEQVFEVTVKERRNE